MLEFLGNWCWLLVPLGLVLLYMASVAWSTMVVATSYTLAETNEGAGITTTSSVTLTGDSNISTTPALLASTANQQVNCNFTVSRLKSLLLLSDITCTVYVNAASTGSPTDTITLTANKPWFWYDGSGITCPIAGTAGVVSNLYVTVAGAVAGTLKIRATVDATP